MVWIIRSDKRQKGDKLNLPMRFERGNHVSHQAYPKKRKPRLQTKTYKQQPLPLPSQP
jgi:hypothetical protein